MEGYNLQEHLGAGAFGTVGKYKTPPDKPFAQQHEYVAIKTIQVTSDKALAKVLCAEAPRSFLQELNHDHIIKCLEILIENKNLHIVMEFADYGSLRDYINYKKGGLLWNAFGLIFRPLTYLLGWQQVNFSEVNVWGFIYQMSSAIEYMHGRNILHRDIKPENIVAMGTPQGGIRLKIADFGIATQMDRYSEGYLYTRTQIGTYIYMSPEALRGGRYGKPTDIWSLGAVISAFCNDGLDLFCTPKAVFDWPGGRSSLPKRYNITLRQLTADMLFPYAEKRPTATTVRQKAARHAPMI